MTKNMEARYPETTKREDGKVTERNPPKTSTPSRNRCLSRVPVLRNPSIITCPAAQPQTFHSGMIAKGLTSRFVEDFSSNEDLQSVVKNTGAAKTFDEMLLPPGKVRSATAYEEQTQVRDLFEAYFRRHY